MASLKKQLEIESKSGADLGAGHSVCISDVKCHRRLCSPHREGGQDRIFFGFSHQQHNSHLINLIPNVGSS